MTYKVGPKGQVVLPKRIRELLGIEPGDDVTVEPHEGGALVRRVPHGSSLYGMLADIDVDLLAELEAEHRREREREDAKFEGWDS
jgi:AbrB family looped-hinge helix DNA binding protein